MGLVPNEAVQFTRAGVRLGAKRTVPLALSSFAFSLVFGVLAHQAGLSLAEAMLMSGLVFAGAAQYIAVGLWLTPVPVVAIVVTTLIVNLRHLLMGAALRPWFSRLSAPKSYGSIFFMTDESWALLMREFTEGGRDAAFLVGSGLMMFIPWVTGTAVGHTLGGGIQSSDLVTWSLDFIFTAVFTALLVSLWKGKSDLFPWAAAAVVAVAAKAWLPGTWYILLGGIAGSVVGAIRDAD